ncbi:MAG TPA: DUF5715 family protein [Edaphobacter sp.]|nr:DUF5715 family protein [Edaphobacter sp.]
MMRSIAPITALLALAAMCFFPANSVAKSTHHRASKTRTPAATATHGKHSANPSHSVHRHNPAAPDPIHAQRASAHHHTRHATNSTASPQARQARLRASEKASSDDFIKAAETPAPVAIHGTSRPEELNEAPLPSAARRSASVSKPVPVVGVVRRNSPRPQLPSVEEAAANPVILPSLYNKRGRLIVPPPLKGSREILVRQNQVADRDGLDRIQNDEDLLDMRNKRLLVSLPASNALQIDERLPANRRYCRPWVAQFLATMARAHYAHFHSALQVNSAVRTVEFQQHLVHINGNAAPAEGDTASPHLTGQAIDIAKHGLSLTEIAWLRGYLLPLVQEGKVDVEEEFQQSCFHISVYRKYLPPAATPNPNPAPSRHSETTALAAAMR